MLTQLAEVHNAEQAMQFYGRKVLIKDKIHTITGWTSTNCPKEYCWIIGTILTGNKWFRADDLELLPKERAKQEESFEAAARLIVAGCHDKEKLLTTMGFSKCTVCGGMGHEIDVEATHKIYDTIAGSGDCFGIDYTVYKDEPCSAGCIGGWSRKH